MEILNLHKWDLSPAEARGLQAELAGQICLKSIRKKPRFVAGLDCSLDKRRGLIFAAAVVFSYPELAVVEVQTARRPLVFPYVPGLLSFREGPVCLAAIDKLQAEVDVFLVDGQGIAHPRRLGLAAHLGLFVGRPTIGCAKSRLIGAYEEVGNAKGSWSPLHDKDEQIGAVVRTRDRVKPLFVSPGHLCGFADAVELTLACAVKYRLPEPTRIAHQTVSQVKTTECTE